MLYTFSKAVKHHGASEMWKNLHDEAKKKVEWKLFSFFYIKNVPKDRKIAFAQAHFFGEFFFLMYFIILKRISTIGFVLFFHSLFSGPSFEMPRNQQDDFLHFKQRLKKLYFRFVFKVSNYKVSVNLFTSYFFGQDSKIFKGVIGGDWIGRTQSKSPMKKK